MWSHGIFIFRQTQFCIMFRCKHVLAISYVFEVRTRMVMCCTDRNLAQNHLILVTEVETFFNQLEISLLASCKPFQLWKMT